MLRGTIFAALAIGMLAAPSVASAQTLRLATLEWAPFAGESLPRGGLATALIEAAFAESGMTVETDVLPWLRAQESVRAGTHDVLSCSWESAERREQYVFPEQAVVDNRIVFIKPAGSDFEFADMSSLDGLTIATMDGYAYSDAFDTATSFEREASSTLPGNLRKVAAGRVDLAIEDELVARHTIATEAPDLADALAFTDGSLVTTPCYAVFSPNIDPAIVAAFESGLTAIRENGTYDAITAEFGLN